MKSRQLVIIFYRTVARNWKESFRIISSQLHVSYSNTIILNQIAFALDKLCALLQHSTLLTQLYTVNQIEIYFAWYQNFTIQTRLVPSLIRPLTTNCFTFFSACLTQVPILTNPHYRID